MPTLCFVSYEIHPTTWGGCGVLLHHAAELLLRAGHTVVFLLDVSDDLFHRFDRQDRLTLSNAASCRAYQVEALCRDFPYTQEQAGGLSLFKSLRFAHACRKLTVLERLDYIEFFEYCGPGYFLLARRVFGEDADGPVLGVRLHTSIELIDYYGSPPFLDHDRYSLYALERGGLRLAEAVLTPTQTYYEALYRDRYGIEPQRVVVSQSPKLDFPRVTRRPDADGPFRIVSLGRLYQCKGTDQLVQAAVALMRQRPELHFTVDLIGPDCSDTLFGIPYADFLRSMIPESLRERFRFTGHLAHAEIAARLNDALFAVFPNRLESFCYAVHEVYDAGVPLVVNDIPAFADFFRHEHNALVYDGSTGGLLTAMRRMIDEPALRERLARPCPVADQPLGDFYDRPIRLVTCGTGVQPVIRRLETGATVADAAAPPDIVTRSGPSSRKLILVLCGENGAGADAMSAELGRQTDRDFAALYLHPGQPPQGGTLWWLGRPWLVRGGGNELSPSDLRTADAIVTLDAADRPDPTWLERCGQALLRRPQLGFAGTWLRCGDQVVNTQIDIAPELYPSHYGAALTRALIRTEPGRLLVDLSDANLGPLGEVACLWSAVGRTGHGCLWPEPLMEVLPGPPEPLNAGQLHYLLARFAGPFADRLAMLTGMQHEKMALTAPTAQRVRVVVPVLTTEQKLGIAGELGGRDLMKIAVRKARGRLWGRIRGVLNGRRGAGG